MLANVMERPSVLRAGIGLRVRRAGAARMLHISKILLLRDVLELTDEQVEKLHGIRSEVARRLIEATADLRNTRFDSYNTIVHKPINFDKLRENSKTVSQLQAKRKLAVIDGFDKASKVLTEEQRDKLSESLSDWIGEIEEEAYESED